MTRRSFYNALSRAVRELEPEVEVKAFGDIRFKIADDYEYCPITLVHRHRTGEAVETGEAWEAAAAMGLSVDDRDAVIDAADWADEEPRVRAVLLRRAGVAGGAM